MTDTIGWGEVDDRPRRLPRVRLNRRRRIALTVVAALVAGGIVGWPPFRSWRADLAARQLQHIWARAEGFDNARVQALSAVQPTLNSMDRAAFADAVAAVDVEEAAQIDRLLRQAKGLRTWTADVAAARRAIVRALLAQTKGLREQASHPRTITVDIPLTTAVDAGAIATAELVDPVLAKLQSRHHLRILVPTAEHLGSANRFLAMLRRPTDQLLHLQLVGVGSDGLTITDLDTGRVVVRRALEFADPLSWQPQRLLGRSVVGSEDGATVIIPFSNGEPEHVIRNVYAQSSNGSPMWVTSIVTSALHAVDESGRTVSKVVRLPDGIGLTGFGNGSVLLATTPSPTEFDRVAASPGYLLFHPKTGQTTKIPATGCSLMSTLDGDRVVVASGRNCAFATDLQLFDLSARLIRTTLVPAGEFLGAQPICAPDGNHVAVLSTPKDSSDPNGIAPTTVRLLDTRTGTWLTVRNSEGWVPVAWSSDGKTLLVQRTDNTGFSAGQQYGQLAYVHVDDPSLHSIRVAADSANYLT